MQLQRIAISLGLILFLAAMGPVLAIENQANSFLMAQTRFTPVSGDCGQGKGVLKITGFEGNPNITGTYTGECRDNRPHGTGELVSQDPASSGKWPRVVKGTWNNGAYDGVITFTFPSAGEPNISKEVYTYKNDQRDGQALIYDGKNRLVLIHEYRDNRLISSMYVDPGGKKIPFKYSPDYLTGLFTNTNTALAEYHRALIFDDWYIKTLNDEQTAAELFRLQQALDENLSSFIFIKEKGITIYQPEITGRLNLFSLMHGARLNHLQLGLGRPMTRSYEHAYTSQFLGMADCLYYTPPEKRPSVPEIVDAVKKINVPGSLTAGITIYLAPFGIEMTNGYYDTKYGTITLFGSGPFQWAAGPSTIAHEMGHAVQARLLNSKELTEFWSLRSVPPRKSKMYAWKDEVFAEDFRILFGNSASAIVMREGEWRGKYGDIREFPDKKKQVLEFLNKKINTYTPYQPLLDWSRILYNRLFTPAEKIAIQVTKEAPLQAKVFRFQRIPMGAIEKYQKKTYQVQFTGITNGEYNWTFPQRTDFPWDLLEILENGELVHTCRPDEIFKITTDQTKKYEGRYIKFMEPRIDGPIEYFVEKTVISSKILGKGEAIFNLQDYPSGFYQLEITTEPDDGTGWNYFFVVYADSLN